MANDIIIFSPVFLPWDLALAFAWFDFLLEQSVKEMLPNFMLTLVHLNLRDQSSSTETFLLMPSFPLSCQKEQLDGALQVWFSMNFTALSCAF